MFFGNKYPNSQLQKPSKGVVVNFIKNTRRDHGAKDVWRMLEYPEWANVGEGDDRSFLQVNRTYRIPGCNKQHRLTLSGHPDLIFLLRRRGLDGFMDGTFRCIPNPFTQCQILMIFNEETQLYIPVVCRVRQQRCLGVLAFSSPGEGH